MSARLIACLQAAAAVILWGVLIVECANDLAAPDCANGPGAAAAPGCRP